jgi:glucokinase
MTQIVSVDIGGTHARFAIATIADDGAITLGEPETLHTCDHASFQTAYDDFRTRSGGTLPRAVAIAIAGPVGGEVIRFTNNPWIIRPALVAEKMDVDTFTIVNDFAAVAHAVARADADHMLALAGPDVPLPQEGAITVIGPGTGLGVAILLRHGGAYHVQATSPRATPSRTRSWPGCASATPVSRWSAWSPAPPSSTSTRRSPAWKAGLWWSAATWRSGLRAPTVRTAWRPRQ